MKNKSLETIATARQMSINMELFRLKFISIQKGIHKISNELIDHYRKVGKERNPTEQLSKLFTEYDAVVKEFVNMDARIRNKDFAGIVPPKKQLDINFGGEYITATLGDEESEVFDSGSRNLPHKSGMLTN